MRHVTLLSFAIAMLPALQGADMTRQLTLRNQDAVRIHQEAMQRVQPRLAETGTVLAGSEPYDLGFFRTYAETFHSLDGFFAKTSEEVIEEAGLASELGTVWQVAAIQQGSAELLLNWAFATVLGLSAQAATYRAEISELHISSSEQGYTSNHLQFSSNTELADLFAA